MDLAFIKLNRTIEEALSYGDYKNTQFPFCMSIQLSPYESYLQMTNVDGGVAFMGEYEVKIIDICEKELADITDHVFISEYSYNGVGQMAIEFVNINRNYGDNAVILKFIHTISDVVFFTNPILITDKHIEDTIRFDYKSNLNIPNYPYENAPFYQSIRIECEYVKRINKNEVGEYKQISSGNVISTRLLKYMAHEYRCNTIDLHTYDALDQLFANNLIYIDGKRITTNPTLSEEERKEYSNLFSASFECYRNDSDIYTPVYQIFEGLEVTQYSPLGLYTIDTLPINGSITFNIPVTFSSDLMISLYGSGGLIQIYEQGNFVLNENEITIIGMTSPVATNGTYYLHVSSGITATIGVPFEGFSDNTTWVFVVTDGQFNGLQFNNTQFLTN